MNSQQKPDVIKTIDRVSPELVKDASQFQAAILADVNGRRGTVNSRVRPLAST